jgi:hypothetical protein
LSAAADITLVQDDFVEHFLQTCQLPRTSPG